MKSWWNTHFSLCEDTTLSSGHDQLLLVTGNKPSLHESHNLPADEFEEDLHLQTLSLYSFTSLLIFLQSLEHFASFLSIFLFSSRTSF